MAQDHILINIITLIATAVFIVAIFRHFRLSPVLGYLVAGAALGDHGLRIVTFDQTKGLAEFGVVFLLFAIGLELSFERLKAMRKYVFGLGSLQVLITTLIISGTVILTFHNINAAIIIGGGLALSSTAIVLRVIEENKMQATQVGRIALSILILQDFIVVPLLVITPLLGDNATMTSSLSTVLLTSFVKAIFALFGIFICGRVFLRPIFSFISSDQDSNELAVAITLLVVLSAAFGTEYFQLSLALGAFIAGVLVAETEFRIQAEKSIYPFKSLFLGLFFMTVGMKIDVFEIYSEITLIILMSLGLIIVKTVIITILCVMFGFNRGISVYSGLLLAQGGEFAFILFGLGKENGILTEHVANILLLVVTCTMALTPLLAFAGQKIFEKIESILGRSPIQIVEYGARDLTNHVIIGGFGRVGKMIARVLEAENINYIALDVNNDIVVEEISNGFPVFKGDISSLETLQAIGAERAITVLLAINNKITIKKALKSIYSNFNHLDIIVRLKNLRQAKEFYDAGASVIIPEDYEIGLQLGGAVLKSTGVSENEINRLKSQFRAGGYTIAKKDRILIASEKDV
ncbi:MAG: cation:proton antiporter [Rickettsiaceae bacterium]